MKIEIRATRSKEEAMSDMITGTVFDESGNSESFIVYRRRDEIYLCVSRGLLTKTVYDLFSKILKKYAKCVCGPLIKGRESIGLGIPIEIARLMDENWIWSQWRPEAKVQEIGKCFREREELAKEAINAVWKTCSTSNLS